MNTCIFPEPERSELGVELKRLLLAAPGFSQFASGRAALRSLGRGEFESALSWVMNDADKLSSDPGERELHDFIMQLASRIFLWGDQQRRDERARS
ncbi:TPA: hypothetical protein DF272_02060 [Candidatus Falkowbacteria bacterium]|nr:hypothetical protein [Candidatus Falkowbacteria bacterium]